MSSRTFYDPNETCIRKYCEECCDLCQADFAFLADFTGNLAALNQMLQEKDKTIGDMISSISNFLQQQRSFANIEDHVGRNPTAIIDVEKYVKEIKLVLTDFETRFENFDDIIVLTAFYLDSSNDTFGTESIALKCKDVFGFNQIVTEDEIIKMRCDLFLRAGSDEDDFWELVPK